MLEDPVFGQLVKSQNGSICSQQKSYNQLQDDVFKSKNITASINLTYSLTNSLEHIQYQNQSKTNINNIKSIILNETNLFKCFQRNQDHINNSYLFDQKDSIVRNNNLIHFFSYIIQFKLKNCQSYNTKNLLCRSTPLQLLSQKSKATNVTKSNKVTCVKKKSRQLIFNEQNRLSDDKIRKKCQEQMITHEGFCCDICHNQPIKGSRFHCQQCKNYDLCTKCYLENGHQHSMEQTKKCKNSHQMSGLLNLLTKSQFIQSINFSHGVQKKQKNSKSFQ